MGTKCGINGRNEEVERFWVWCGVVGVDHYHDLLLERGLQRRLWSLKLQSLLLGALRLKTSCGEKMFILSIVGAEHCWLISFRLQCGRLLGFEENARITPDNDRTTLPLNPYSLLPPFLVQLCQQEQSSSLFYKSYLCAQCVKGRLRVTPARVSVLGARFITWQLNQDQPARRGRSKSLHSFIDFLAV